MAKVAIYVRVSTDRQTTQNQLDALRDWAARAGHIVVAEFEDLGISGSKGRDRRPGFDRALKGCVRREFEILAVWSSDRLGRSIQHLLDVLQTLKDTAVGLYIHTQALDTTTPSGRALFQMLGVFSELEREMIVARVNAGLARARSHGTKSGKAIGRPRGNGWTEQAVRDALVSGLGVRKVARQTGASPASVHAVRKALIGDGLLTARAVA